MVYIIFTFDRSICEKIITIIRKIIADIPSEKSESHSSQNKDYDKFVYKNNNPMDTIKETAHVEDINTELNYISLETFSKNKKDNISK